MKVLPFNQMIFYLLELVLLLRSLQTPYNPDNTLNPKSNNIELRKLSGYLVTNEGTIELPILGVIKVVNKTTRELELSLIKLLEKGGHLIKAFVNIRLINAKVTILGEVNNPGTYTFLEQTYNFTSSARVCR